MKFIIDGGAIAEEPRIDENLVRLIVRARMLAQRFHDNPAATIEDIAAEEGYGATYAGRLFRLTSLTSDIVGALLDGGHPPELTAKVLMADTRLPLEWSGQRAVLGFPAKAVAACGHHDTAHRHSPPSYHGASRPISPARRRRRLGRVARGPAEACAASGAPRAPISSRETAWRSPQSK